MAGESQGTQMKILFILKTGATIEWPVPDDAQEGFNFMMFCTNIRLADFFQCPNMHVKYADMSAILHSSEAAPMPEVKGTLQ